MLDVRDAGLLRREPMAESSVSGWGRIPAPGEERRSEDLDRLTRDAVLTRGTLYARTGGQFTRLGNGETAARGPYGVSAVDTATGKTLWRFKGADKGITNIALVDPATVSHAAFYQLMIGVIVPRPIAFVSTLDPQGRRNRAGPLTSGFAERTPIVTLVPYRSTCAYGR